MHGHCLAEGVRADLIAQMLHVGLMQCVDSNSMYTIGPGPASIGEGILTLHTRPAPGSVLRHKRLVQDLFGSPGVTIGDSNRTQRKRGEHENLLTARGLRAAFEHE
jgi:hypothetical protein